MLSGVEVVNSDDGCVENISRMGGDDSLMNKDDDMDDFDEMSVVNDDDSDNGYSDCDELDYKDKADDDDDSATDDSVDFSGAMNEPEADESDLIIISD